MTYTPKSFFGRPVTAARRDDLRTDETLGPVDKWHVLDALTEARAALNLSHSDLAVLSALLSFHPTREIAHRPTPIVFASNKALTGRLNGMPDSTMRRHLTRLLAAGIVSRQDSPNGKRYVRRSRDGQIAQAFGFDLTPLIRRAAEFEATAEQMRQQAADLNSLREKVSLMRRDLLVLGQEAVEWEELLETARTGLRRRPQKAHLLALKAALQHALSIVDHQAGTAEMSSSARQNEQHYHRTNKDTSDLKEAENKTADPSEGLPKQQEVRVTLQQVIATCPTIQSYFPDKMRSWHELENNAVKIAPMIGIGHDVLIKLHAALGGTQAAIAILCVLERLATIANPAGYLRKLSQKADAGQFNLMNLLKTVEKHVELSADNSNSRAFSYV
jgi:replication initiation protein RepC